MEESVSEQNNKNNDLWYGEVNVSESLDTLLPLFVDQHKEVEGSKDLFPVVDVNRGAIEQMAQLGVLRLWAAARFAGPDLPLEIAGYIAFATTPHLVYNKKVATEVAYYVVPKFRQQGVGKKLLSIAEYGLKENGYAESVVMSVKINEGSKEVMERSGYSLIEHVYAKGL